MHLLQVAEDLAAQVEHHLLAGPLHVIGLGEFQEETEAQQENVEAAELGDSGQRARAQPAVQKTVHAGLLREIFINRNLGEQRAHDVGRRLEHDGAQRERHLPFVRAQIAEQPLHQTAVISFSQGFFFVDAGH